MLLSPPIVRLETVVVVAVVVVVVAVVVGSCDINAYSQRLAVWQCLTYCQIYWINTH